MIIPQPPIIDARSLGQRDYFVKHVQTKLGGDFILMMSCGYCMDTKTLKQKVYKMCTDNN